VGGIKKKKKLNVSLGTSGLFNTTNGDPIYDHPSSPDICEGAPSAGKSFVNTHQKSVMTPLMTHVMT